MTTPEERAREIIDRASSLSQGGSVSEASQSLVASRAGARMRDELSIVSPFPLTLRAEVGQWSPKRKDDGSQCRCQEQEPGDGMTTHRHPKIPFCSMSCPENALHSIVLQPTRRVGVAIVISQSSTSHHAAAAHSGGR